MITSTFAPIVFGLASAACWGAGDFCGGLATKRTHVYGVIIASQLVGVAMLIGLALAFADPAPLPVHLLWGALGGLAGTVGLIAFYSALASGRMGVAAPVGGVIGAAAPVIIGAFLEGWPGTLRVIGFVLGLIAVWFISLTEDAAFRARELGLPIIAGLCFGIFFLFIWTCLH